MLRIVVNNSSAGAKSYYSQGLAKDDYYTKEKETEIVGQWGGKGCELLGLNGTVNQDEFARLCDNINPLTGEQLTARNIENRRVGYDINFHAPKSVSLVYSVTQDEDILKAFRSSVNEAMQELEKDMNTRVRKAGQFDNRNTGNIIYGEFIHTTSRPVDGVPDPHLHAHCFTFNATYDKKEGQWKAGEFGKIKKDASYFEAYFYSKFADRLKSLGYGIEQTKNGWEIGGIKRETIEKFSRRTTEIEKIARDKGITDAKAKDQIGAKTRKGKDKTLSANDLVKNWLTRLTDREKTDVLTAREDKEVNKLVEMPKHYIDLAVEHVLERKSVAGEREILKHAFKRSVGQHDPEQIIKAYSNDSLLKANVGNEVMLTTREAINEERKLVRLATESKGQYAPVFKDYQIQGSHLNSEQQDAVRHILNSKDGIILIEGDAGVGKTTLLKEVKLALQIKGKEIFAFAPTSKASKEVLRNEGFHRADTVARLIIDKELQKTVKGNFIIIDESGLLGNKTMNQVFEIARRQNARLILTGDIKQHNSVERGDTFRLILEKSKIKSVRVNEIQRQRSNPEYKDVVRHIAANDQFRAFQGLEKMNAIHEIEIADSRYSAIAKDYASSAKSKRSVAVIAPTHAEGETVTFYIRNELKNQKLIGKEEQLFTVQKKLSPTEEEKRDKIYYQEGMAIQFNQNAKGFKRGAVYDVMGKDEKGNVMIGSDGIFQPLPFKETSKFSVHQKASITLSKGDVIRITQNGFSMNKKRLDNGANLRVKGFDNDRNIIVSTGNQDITIRRDYRNFSYGYCATSHSSQGETVDKVIISQSSISRGAASREQFYVSVSRGKMALPFIQITKMN